MEDGLFGLAFSGLIQELVEAGETAGLLADKLPVIAGVLGPDPAIGGRVPTKEAPKDDVGLKVFKPASPVTCDLTEEIGDIDPVEGVVCVEVGEKSEAPVTTVGCEVAIDEKASELAVEVVALFVPPVPLANAKDEATLEMSTAPGLSEL